MRNVTFGSLILVTLGVGCSNQTDPTPEPDAPVASNAAEAWPDQPAGVAPITEENILEACATSGACSAEVAALSPEERLGLIDICVYDAVFSAERAIPLTGFNHENERVEWWVSCVQSATDCSAIETCRTERDQNIVCEEDGCRAYGEFNVSCNGSIATLTGSDQTFTRDCSRAYVECDATSPTGCADRHFSRCPDGIDTSDRCDGNVRLGCDSGAHVSFHDCTRLGGTCGLASDGSQDCVYPTPSSPDCKASQPAACDGGNLSACVNGHRVSVPTSFCPAK